MLGMNYSDPQEMHVSSIFIYLIVIRIHGLGTIDLFTTKTYSFHVRISVLSFDLLPFLYLQKIIL